jgi:catechol 2,3-dioxygenase-like lactoylglutathione lyase family enzyme
MSKVNQSHSVKFGRSAPTIPVTDIQKSINFYSEVLGMTKVFENGNPVVFAILVRGEAEFHLTQVKNYKANDRNLAHLMVEDATTLHDHLRKHGVQIVKGLQTADYGLRQFVFVDPDGNRIDVGQDI